ncbi:MAG: hydroxymethylglutaryl-CoA synthase, partial [Dehalococcoidia bacterium]|nr:hydroxymethylglutaryl-CoA synthase [Dehalococcoidia bacterium]
MSKGIVSFGVYVPKYRVKREDIAKAWGGRARGEISIAHPNEDSATMAAEAAYTALQRSGLDPEQIDALYMATDSAPYIEHSLARATADTLRMKPEADVADFSTSPRAGAVALKSCLDAVGSGRIKYGLVAISDSRPVSAGSDEELSFGAGATAFLVGNSGVIAEVEDTYTWSTYLVDSWREAGANSVHSHEPRFTREFGYSQHVIEATRGLLGKLKRNIRDYSHAVLQYHPDEKVMRGVARTLGITPEQIGKGNIGAGTGDTGAASVPLGLAAVLEEAKAGERILLVFYGSAAGEAMSLVVTSEAERARSRGQSLNSYLNSKDYIDYLSLAKMRGLLQKAETPGRTWVSPLSPSWYRDGAVIRRLVGARCTECGYVNFPPTMRRICIRCGNTKFDEVLRSRRGKVHTFCVNIY